MWAITEYRFRRWADKTIFKIPVLGFLLYYIFRITISNIIYTFSGIELSAGSDIGPGLVIYHGNGIVVAGGVKIGKNCTLNHQITLGSGKGGYPKVGNNCVILSGSKVFGEINIGDNVIIGANSVVNKSFPSNVIIAGVPAKILNKRKKK